MGIRRIHDSIPTLSLPKERDPYRYGTLKFWKLYGLMNYFVFPKNIVPIKIPRSSPDE
jgi:hypothetical protein